MRNRLLRMLPPWHDLKDKWKGAIFPAAEHCKADATLTLCCVHLWSSNRAAAVSSDTLNEDVSSGWINILHTCIYQVLEMGCSVMESDFLQSFSCWSWGVELQDTKVFDVTQHEDWVFLCFYSFFFLRHNHQQVLIKDDIVSGPGPGICAVHHPAGH